MNSIVMKVVPSLTDFMDGGDVRMTQRGGSLCLRIKRSIRSRFAASPTGRIFSNFAIQSCVLGQIDLAHPALADLRADFIATDSPANQRC